MFSAADLIHAVQRRLLLVAPHRRRPPGEFPPGWAAWFASMRERAGAVTGAPAEAFVEAFLQRPPAVPPPRVGDLSRWQAFTRLWRQGWHPADYRDRRLSWAAALVTALWHLLFGALLLYLMYLRYAQVGEPPQGEDVVQVEFVGAGTPQEPGGGAPPSEQAQPAAPSPAQPPTRPQSPASRPAGAVPPPALPQPALEAPLPDVPQREVPEPQLPATPAPEQPVTVSEPTPQAPEVFVLPPTRRRPPEPRIEAPRLSAPSPALAQREVAEPVQPIRRELPRPELAAPSLDAPEPQVREREVAAPLPRPAVRPLDTPPLPVPELRAAAPPVRTAEVPMPSPPSAGPPRAAASQAAPAATPAATPPATAAPAPAAAPRPGDPGAGPRPAPAPGSWSTPARSDDWGASTRNSPGAQRGTPPGLYDRDGSVRVPEPSGSASPGMPPGTITQEIKDLDRAGTWLKRKPNDYEPTSFDRYWVPNETLLAEWVRKGIEEVSIPLPGTNKRIQCIVSLLAFGGACGLSDPNLNEQPATARPPPDIPFKPELQEDNGSVRR
ncbi:hypothetical protein EDC50_0930 [Vulcaniibacterium tengchongense]|uniref:Transmembrane repetitive protein n=1 Tax=Vulcaniibacterium tengchongense TaxID=1273429 RepID=A0A3N4VJ63_9GAMM|nr:hypothetical protein [Vulcaniibacterium tengchongense]RPE81733.1 hypothetical protein EDC50_0930 [Vulcaniibacterium tengchongense]